MIRDPFTELRKKCLNRHQCTSVDKSREIMGRIRDIRKSLTSGQQEKLSLMQDLARLKDEFPHQQTTGWFLNQMSARCPYQTFKNDWRLRPRLTYLEMYVKWSLESRNWEILSFKK